MSNEDERAGNTPENAGGGPGEHPSGVTQASQQSNGNAAPEAAEISVEDRLAKLDADNRELKDRLLRNAAEFENFKKRTKKEMDDAATRGREQLLKELLPAIDNLERALKHAPEGDPLAVGVKQTEKLLLQALEKFGVTRFSSLGKPFDPSLHDAIQQVETSDHAPGTVAQEFASGYTLGTRLLRAAMVAVAKAPSNAPSNGGGHANGGDGGGGQA
jgi:molecular chaperone GrpE